MRKIIIMVLILAFTGLAVFLYAYGLDMFGNSQFESFTNSIGQEFVLIPAGEFMMGSDDCRSYEKPVHKVKITKPFYMQTTEVTQKQWKTIMGNNPSKFKGDNQPVEEVSWNEIQEFIKKLNQQEGTNKYRLPTEAEWEYACRAGSTGMYCFGNSERTLGEYAWYKKNSGNKTHPVGIKKPNKWGLYDIHGNIWEWCHDWYGEDYYKNSPKKDPVGPTSGSYRVIRGGCWGLYASDCRSAYRYRVSPDGRDFAFGFRLCFGNPLKKGGEESSERKHAKEKLSPEKVKKFNELLESARTFNTRDTAIEGLKVIDKALMIKPDDPEALKVQKAIISKIGNMTNSIGQEFVVIPAGSFMMGSEYGNDNEKPVHLVKISESFYVQKTEVTQGQWKALMGNNPSRRKGDDLPVDCLSWEMAQEFVKKLNEKEKCQLYFLPSEAQWEYACRAGSTTKWCFGNDDLELTKYAWYGESYFNGGSIHPTGQKEPNDWGLYDMHGNVWEWCRDYYDEKSYSKEMIVDPFNSEPTGRRIYRGGAWDSESYSCRSAKRGYGKQDTPYMNIGFRLIRKYHE